VWWTQPEEPFDLLSKKTAVFAIGYNGRAFQEIVAGAKPFAVLWAAQVYNVNGLAIRKGSPNGDLAKEFLQYAAAPEHMARQAKWFAYGPARQSAVTNPKHAELGIDMTVHLPTAPANFKNALPLNAAFWRRHGDMLVSRFNDWAEGKIDAAGQNVPEPVKPAVQAAPAGQPSNRQTRSRPKSRPRYEQVQ
jgi:putative spermidine/putrescine transport system substrate-binding protein